METQEGGRGRRGLGGLESGERWGRGGVGTGDREEQAEEGMERVRGEEWCWG